MADMIKDAIAAAHNHLKVAQENLVEAQTWLEILIAGDNPVPRPLPKTKVFGLTGVWICLALFISLIVLAQFLWRRNSDVTSGSLISKCQHKMPNCLLSACANLKSSPTLITHGDWTSARFLEWKTIALCSMFLVVSVSAVYLAMVTPVFGLTGVWTGLIVFMSLIGTAGLLRLSVIIGQHKLINKEELIISDRNTQGMTSAGAVPQQPSGTPSVVITEINEENMATEINKEDMMTEIKDSIKGLLSLKESLKLTKLDKINKNEVDDIKYAIKAVGLIEEHLTLLKSQNNNYGEHQKKIQHALKPAIDAVQSMKEIIKNGV